MSNSAWYSYPEADGPLQIDDLGETVTEIEEEPIPACDTPTSANGVSFPVLSGYMYRVNVTLRGFQSATPGTAGNSVERALLALENHINRGGLVGFTLDRAKAWAAPSLASLSQGGTSIRTGGNAFNVWEASATLAANDEVVVEMPAPYWKRETVSVSAYSSSTLTVGALRYTYRGAPSVRYRYFYPVLWRHEDDGDAATRIVRNDRTIIYEMSATLRYSPDALGILIGATNFDSGLSVPTRPSGGGVSPAQSLRPTTGGYGASVGATLDSVLGPDRNTTAPFVVGGWR